MKTDIKELYINNFKSYANETIIPLEDLSVLIGANSSGKSTALQVLLIMKQTLECNTPDVELLLSGKYVAVGDFDEVINDPIKKSISIGITSQTDISDTDTCIRWNFEKDTNKYENVILSSVEIIVGKDNYFLKRRGNSHCFSICFDGRETVYQYEIYNMRITNLYIAFDKGLNSLFRKYLIELEKVLFDTEKRVSDSFDSFVSKNDIRDFAFSLIASMDSILHDSKDRDDSSSESRVAKAAVNLIETFVKAQYRGDVNNIGFPEKILIDLIFNKVKESNCTEKLVDTIKCYTKKLSEYLNTDHPIGKFVEKYRLEIEDQLENKILKQNENVETQVYDIISIYNSNMKQLTDHIYYIGPIREKPRGLYNIGFESAPKYVGIAGSYFASVLLHEKQSKEHIVPWGIEKCTLEEALGEWLLYLRIASSAEVEERSSFGYSINITDKNEKTSDIMNVGIGTSQVLPVLIQGLVSDVDDMLFFEQPELHLHPYSQSRLADFLVKLVNHKRKILVETHSEYLILRLRYLIAKNEILADNVKINFFQKSRTTIVFCANLSELGNIVYPEDFKDTTEQLLTDLLVAQMGKRDHK